MLTYDTYDYDEPFRWSGIPAAERGHLYAPNKTPLYKECIDVIDLKSMATTQETTSTALLTSDRAGRTRYAKTYMNGAKFSQTTKSTYMFVRLCGMVNDCPMCGGLIKKL